MPKARRTAVLAASALLLTAAALLPTAAASKRLPLPFAYELYTFRGDGDSTIVVATFAVPAGHLEREHRDGTARYRFDVSLVLTDTLLRTVSRTDDSVYVSISRALSGSHLLFTQVGLQAAPSVDTQQRVIMSDATRPGVGQMYSEVFHIPDYRGRQLMLSDVALAHRGSGAGWERGGTRLALLPASQLPGSAFDIYYEVYNLPRGRPYLTEIMLEGADDVAQPGSGVALRYEGEAGSGSDGTLHVLRHVDASVPRGRYRLTVRVTDQVSGRTASSSRIFHIPGGSGGATPVAALRRQSR